MYRRLAQLIAFWNIAQLNGIAIVANLVRYGADNINTLLIINGVLLILFIFLAIINYAMLIDEDEND